MQKCTLGVLVGVFVLGLYAPLVQAHHCPLLVSDCLALVAQMENGAGVDRKKLAKAKQWCQQALQLHETGKHRAAVIKVGQAITLAGKAEKGSSPTASSGNGASGGY